MKLKLESTVARLAVDLSEEKVAEILGLALSYATGAEPIPQPVVPLPDVPKTTTTEVVSPVTISAPHLAKVKKDLEPKVDEVETVVKKPTAVVAGYKGFLYIQCESCGHTKGFMPKTPITRFTCDCGHTTQLHDMVPLKTSCKCGKNFNYLTNMKDTMFTMECLNCQSPIDMEFNEKRKEYRAFGALY